MRPSRRTALKAGVGAGVGLVAWTGPTITSLGGTPAYAAGCTLVVQFDLVSCRNTDQGNCSKPTANNWFGYHTLKDFGLPTGFAVTNNVPEGTCCSVNHTPVLTFPAGLTCTVTIRIAYPPNCTGTLVEQIVTPPESDGSIDIVLKCATVPVPSQSQYAITVRCNTTGAPTECLTN